VPLGRELCRSKGSLKKYSLHSPKNNKYFHQEINTAKGSKKALAICGLVE